MANNNRCGFGICRGIQNRGLRDLGTDRRDGCRECEGRDRRNNDYGRNADYRREEGGNDCSCSDCNALFKRIQAVDFAIYETVLYLDVYPCSKEALSYYHDLKKERERLVAEYEEKCAPLTMRGNESCERWKWISSPWPWEAEANK